MKEVKTKSVNMTYKALLSYVLNTNYQSVAGIVSLGLSFASIVVLILFWGQLSGRSKALLLFMGLLFTVINPLLLAFRTFKQFKLSPSYKKTIIYEFRDDGIGITQGEQTMTLTWDRIVRLLMTNTMIAIYTNRIHAFVIPLSELGGDRAKIIASLVQFTAQYGPRLSGNLKVYETGKQ